MAFQQVNVAGIEPQGYSFLDNLAEDIAKGYALRHLPLKTRQEERQRQLANQLSQQQYELAPKEFALRSQQIGQQGQYQQYQIMQIAEALKRAQLQRQQDEEINSLLRTSPTPDTQNGMRDMTPQAPASAVPQPQNEDVALPGSQQQAAAPQPRVSEPDQFGGRTYHTGADEPSRTIEVVRPNTSSAPYAVADGQRNTKLLQAVGLDGPENDDVVGGASGVVNPALINQKYGQAPASVQAAVAAPPVVPPGQVANTLNKLAPGERVTLEAPKGNAARLDHIWETRPDLRGRLEAQGHGMKEQIAQSPETGMVFRTIKYPSGRIDVQAVQVGPGVGDQTFSKEMAKGKAETYKAATDALAAGQGTIDSLNEVNRIIRTNPNFKNIVGPVNSVLTKWVGSPEDKELLASLTPHLHQYVIDTLKTVKGAASDKDLAFVNGMKANVGDFGPAFIGKMKALTLAQNLANKRNELIAQYTSEGVEPHNAIARARRETNFDDIREKVNQELRTPQLREKLRDAKEISTYSTKDKDILLTAKRYGMSPEAVIKQLRGQNG